MRLSEPPQTVGQGHNDLVAALAEALDDLEVEVPGGFGRNAVNDGMKPLGDLWHVVIRVSFISCFQSLALSASSPQESYRCRVKSGDRVTASS